MFEYKKDFIENIFKDEIGNLKNINKKEEKVLAKILEENEFVIYFFQERLHNVLAEYLNTPEFLSYKKSKHLITLKPFFKKKIENLNNISISMLPRFIKEGYEFLEKIIIQEDIITTENNINVTIIDRKKYSGYKKILALTDYCKNKFNPYILTMVLHGSCSDLKLTSFSDIDTFLILKRGTVNNEKKIIVFKKLWQKSLKLIYRFDSLQHHTHMFATEIEMNYFPYHWFPPQIFKNSTSIAGKVRFNIKVNKKKLLIFRSFLQLTQRFRDDGIKSKIYDEYSLKNDISVLSLLPALYLQSLNINISKEESFIHKEVTIIDEKDFFKELTKVRKHWKSSLLSKIFISFNYKYIIRRFYLRFIIRKVKKNEITDNAMLKPVIIKNIEEIISSMSDNIIRKIYD
jgi:hypothetical protein